MVSREALMRRDENVCVYCEEPVSLKGSPVDTDRRLATRDHVVPKSRGGSDGSENLVLACARCNFLKGDLHLGDFLALYLKADAAKIAAAIERVEERLSRPLPPTGSGPCPDGSTALMSVYRRFNGRCCYCRRHCADPREPAGFYTRAVGDFVRPRLSGGKSVADTVILACRGCKSLKDRGLLVAVPRAERRRVWRRGIGRACGGMADAGSLNLPVQRGVQVRVLARPPKGPNVRNGDRAARCPVANRRPGRESRGGSIPPLSASPA